MPFEDFVVCDADMHVFEPADLWQRYMTPEYRHAAPIGSAHVNVPSSTPSRKICASSPTHDWSSSSEMARRRVLRSASPHASIHSSQLWSRGPGMC